jgi:hypothetical protein
VTTRRQQLSHEQINIKGEVEYIVRRAAEHDARVVTLNPLIFFSTETGDAWMLDAGNDLALCLARDGDPQPVNITETTETFAIEWNMSYQISSDRFIITDKAGQSRTITGYPIQEIALAIRQALESGGQADSTEAVRRTQATSLEIPGLLKRGNQPGAARQLESLVKAGYGLQQEFRQVALACDKWLEAWELVKQMTRPEMWTTDAFDQAYPSRTQPALN